MRVLRVRMEVGTDSPRGEYELELAELSEGQRTLSALCALLVFAIGHGCTLCIDEPESFVALPEIQPWLIELGDRVRDRGGQALLASHHPELIRYLAHDSATVIERAAAGPARVRPFEWNPENGGLDAAELVARGWALRDAPARARPPLAESR